MKLPRISQKYHTLNGTFKKNMVKILLSKQHFLTIKENYIKIPNKSTGEIYRLLKNDFLLQVLPLNDLKKFVFV